MKKISSYLTVCVLILMLSSHVFAQKPGSKLLDPTNHVLVFIDHQSQMAFATTSIPNVLLRNNVGVTAGASEIFNVPEVVTTVAKKSFSGPLFTGLFLARQSEVQKY